jgi:hypothetical protein
MLSSSVSPTSKSGSGATETSVKSHIVLRVAGVLALFASGLYLWSFLDPPPIPVLLARTIGQTLGTLALACITYALVRENRDEARARESVPPSLRR